MMFFTMQRYEDFLRCANIGVWKCHKNGKIGAANYICL